MKNFLKKQRLHNALERLIKQLASGVKLARYQRTSTSRRVTWSTEPKQYVPLTDTDKARIEKEIGILKTKIS
jgi:hypothetical protein